MCRVEERVFLLLRGEVKGVGRGVSGQTGDVVRGKKQKGGGVVNLW